MLLDLLFAVYLSCALLLTLYAGSEVLLLLAYWRYRNQPLALPDVTEWPSVVVQLPIYNERYVVERLLAAVAALDYPREKLIVQVLDDSADETTAIVAVEAARFRAAGLDIHHIRRENRTGYKAGALAYGLSLVDSDLVMVLDADFVPPPDFLKRTVPYLVANPKLGMVQTRWGHLNPFNNWLTLGQTLALDGHFVVEQTARSRSGLLMSFNGSGGVWRIQCIRDAGGWRDLTLTEDLDLSYRAQLAGWHFLYLPDVVVPGELPPQIAAYKQQQARWAKGSTQCLGYILPPLWHSQFNLPQRVMATLHLCQYLPHPLMVLLLLLTPPLLITHELQQQIPLGLLGIISLGPPLVYVVSQQALYPDWKRRLLAFPVLLALGTGIAWSNSVAVVGGLFGWQTEFRRTPKFARAWEGSGYAMRNNPGLVIELLLAMYAIWGVWLALKLSPALVPYLGVYGFAFGSVALWGIRDTWMARHSSP
ncbi:MAG: glycosyltransferase [Anaerolineae bacterium]|nr:glycosyltransferase [Anaerolineae bacterium]